MMKQNANNDDDDGYVAIDNDDNGDDDAVKECIQKESISMTMN